MAKQKIRTQSTEKFYDSLMALLNKPAGGTTTVAGHKEHVRNELINPTIKPFDFVKELNSGQVGKDIYGNQVHDMKSIQIQRELEQMNWQIKQYGGKPETQHHKSFFTRAMDVLSRPNYAVANAVRNEFKATVQGAGIGGALKAAGSGFVGGLEGKKKSTFGNFIQDVADARHAAAAGKTPEQIQYGEGHANPILKAGGGLALDIFLDPTTYVGTGLVAKLTKAEKAAKDAGEALKGLKGAEKLTEEEHALITGKSIAGKGKALAASSSSDVGKLIAKVSNDTVQSMTDRWEHIYQQALKDGLKKPEAAKMVTAAKDTERIRLNKLLTDNYTRVADTPVERQLAVRFAKAKIAVPGSEKLAKAIILPTKIDPVQKGLDIFLRHMKNSYKILPEIHTAGRQTFGFNIARITMEGHLLKKALGKLPLETREMALQDAIHGGKTGVEVSPGVDVADYVRGRLLRLQSELDGVLDPTSEIKNLDEVNKWIFGDNKIRRVKTTVQEGGKTKQVVAKDWLLQALNDPTMWKHKDAGMALWHLESAVMQAQSIRGIKESLAHSFGVLAEHDLRRTGSHLSQRYGWKTARGLGKDYQKFVFDPEVADSIDKILAELTDTSRMKTFGRTMSRVNAPIKTALTKYSPSFHIRNAIGDWFINHLDNVSNRLDYPLAAEILRSKGILEHTDVEKNVYPLLLREGDPLEQALRFNVGRNKRFSKGLQNRSNLKAADGKVHSYISPAEFYAGYNKFGLRQTYSTNEFRHAFQSGTNPLRATSEFVTKVSEGREDFYRLAHFISLVRQNPTKAKTLEEAMQAAANKVRKTHFDYSDFTKFEKNTMSNAFPFYKWTRKMLPLMVEILMTQPGKVALIPKWERALQNIAGVPSTGNELFPGGVDSIIPEWMQQSGFVPLTSQDKNGNWYFQIPNPVTDVMSQQMSSVGETPTGFQSLLSALTPAAKIPLELSRGKQFYGNIPIKNKKEYFERQLPIGNVLLQTSKGNKGTLASFLSGISFQQNTPRRVKGELLRRRDVAQGKLKHAKAEYYAK